MPNLAQGTPANRWCGVCFQWRVQGSDGRCESCGNAHMRGGTVPPAEGRMPQPQPRDLGDNYGGSA